MAGFRVPILDIRPRNALTLTRICRYNKTARDKGELMYFKWQVMGSQPIWDLVLKIDGRWVWGQNGSVVLKNECKFFNEGE